MGNAWECEGVLGVSDISTGYEGILNSPLSGTVRCY